MKPPTSMDAVREKARLLRESMERSRAVHGDAAAALASAADYMAAIDDAMQPARVLPRLSPAEACRVHDNIRGSLREVEPIVRRLDHLREAERVLLNRPSKGLNAYLDAVDKLRSVEHFFNSKRSSRTTDDVLKHVDELLCKAAVELENEFHRVLSKCSKPVELEYLINCLPSLDQRVSSENILSRSVTPSNGSSSGQINDAAYTLPTLINPRYTSMLSKLIQKSAQLGRHQQFLKMYRQIPGSTMELNLKLLGVEYVTTEEVQNMQAESLDAKITHWIQFYQIGLKLLFAAERQLCDQIFEGNHTLKNNCFAEVTAISLSTLLSFGMAVAKSEASAEVFVLLDMYEATLELRPEVEAVFEGSACSDHRKSALSLSKSLAQTIEGTFNDFKQNILKESANSVTIDGAVHPFTRYVINYTKFLFDYQSSLKQIFKECGTGDGENSDLLSQIRDFIHALETNLESNSKQYKDPCLAHLFLMNNIQYIVRSICRSEVKDMFGDDWIQRQRRIVQQHGTNFRRVSWGKVLACLSAPGLTSSLGSTRASTQEIMCAIIVCTIRPNSSTTSKPAIKERLRSFNMQFEEVRQAQINWAVPDKELRDNLILAIGEVLLPAYRNFLEHFRSLVGNSHNHTKYIKYTPEALEEALRNLFAKKLLVEQGC
ncbi:hypothetical protein ACP4OV_025993 [Aristida adscensionis]